MTEAERIKEIIKKDKNFRRSFLGVKNIKTAVAIARSKGFGITKDDILNDNELSDCLLEASAGGKWRWYDIAASVLCPGYAVGKAISEANNDDKPRTQINTRTQINNYYNITNNDQRTKIEGDNNTVQSGIQNNK